MHDREGLSTGCPNGLTRPDQRLGEYKRICFFELVLKNHC